jgi:triosephosphate isomerase
LTEREPKLGSKRDLIARVSSVTVRSFMGPILGDLKIKRKFLDSPSIFSYFRAKLRNQMTHLPYIVGNWKMYKGAKEASLYIEQFFPLVEMKEAHLFLAVPFTAISAAADVDTKGKIAIGAQNMHDAREGAFTGEIAASMLKEAGATFVLLGHSERRHLFNETDEMIQKKVKSALDEALLPILCVGETLAERESGQEKEVIARQLFSALEEVSLEREGALLIAYEPVWAIGTGKTATASIAGEMHSYIRSLLIEKFGEEMGKEIAILYGGSVSLKTAAELMSEKEIGGVLVGGASLDPKMFAAIVAECIATRKI